MSANGTAGFLRAINTDVQALVKLSRKVSGAARDADVAAVLGIELSTINAWKVVHDKFLTPLDGLAKAVTELNAKQAAREEADTASKQQADPQAKMKAPDGLLSLRDYAATQAALELSICWGVYPLLDHGLGLSVSARPMPKTFKG